MCRLAVARATPACFPMLPSTRFARPARLRVNTYALPGNIGRAQQRRSTRPRLAHGTKTPHLEPNLSDTPTHVHAVQCTWEIGWTSKVAPPARPCLGGRSANWAGLGQKPHLASCKARRHIRACTYEPARPVGRAMSRHNMHSYFWRASQPLPCVHCRGVYSGAKGAACAGGKWG